MAMPRGVGGLPAQAETQEPRRCLVPWDWEWSRLSLIIKAWGQVSPHRRIEVAPAHANLQSGVE